jgi:hypothetical protein
MIGLVALFPAASAAPYPTIDVETVYDVSDFWWTLYTGENYDPDELLDLYVDMCPRKWRQEEPASCAVTGDDLPYNRMLISADHHGVQTPVESHLEDHIGYP